MPYGPTSYTRIEDARSVTYAVRKKGPGGSEIRLVPNYTTYCGRTYRLHEKYAGQECFMI